MESDAAKPGPSTTECGAAQPWLFEITLLAGNLGIAAHENSELLWGEDHRLIANARAAGRQTGQSGNASTGSWLVAGHTPGYPSSETDTRSCERRAQGRIVAGVELLLRLLLTPESTRWVCGPSG